MAEPTNTTQTFWLGATSALAVVFFLLFIGVISGHISINGIAGDTAAKKADDTIVKKEVVVGDDIAEANDPTPSIIIEPVSDTDWVRGDRNAKVSIIEFSDVDCPFCTRFHNSMKEIVAEYDGQVNWVYRDFPLDQLHPNARDKAIAAECVGKLAGNDAYWSYLDGLFDSNAAGETEAEALKLGVDATAFAACRADAAIAAEVKDDEEQGVAAGARGTPYSVIVAGDTTIPLNGAQPTASIKEQLDKVLR